MRNKINTAIAVRHRLEVFRKDFALDSLGGGPDQYFLCQQQQSCVKIADGKSRALWVVGTDFLDADLDRINRVAE